MNSHISGQLTLRAAHLMRKNVSTTNFGGKTAKRPHVKENLSGFVIVVCLFCLLMRPKAQTKEKTRSINLTS
jgi:hypothetical protein